MEDVRTRLASSELSPSPGHMVMQGTVLNSVDVDADVPSQELLLVCFCVLWAIFSLALFGGATLFSPTIILVVSVCRVSRMYVHRPCAAVGTSSKRSRGRSVLPTYILHIIHVHVYLPVCCVHVYVYAYVVLYLNVFITIIYIRQ